MRKDVNKKSNNRSKVVSALAMLLVSAVALSSASYAWFTMSKEVKVDGIQLQASAPENVLICNNDADYTKIESYAQSKTLDNTTKDLVTDGTTLLADNKISYKDNQNKTNEPKLIPVSSADGKTFYTTDNYITTEGKITAEQSLFDEVKKTGTAKSEGVVANERTSLYYVDVPLYILTTGEGNVNLKLDESNSKVKAAANETKNIYKAVKFAILDEGENNLANNVYGVENSYFDNNSAVIGVTDRKVKTDGGYSTANTILVNKNEGATAENRKTFELLGTSNVTGANVYEKDSTTNKKYHYKKIIVRIWIEGQNTNCITDKANTSFNINLTFTK